MRRRAATSEYRGAMLWTIVVILLALWLLGFLLHVAGALIHLLLVVAVIVIAYRLITGRSAV
jgi:hypothetical protein